MRDWLDLAGLTLGDVRRCAMSRPVWIACTSIALVIALSNKAAPALLSVVVSLLGHGAAFMLANLVLADHDRRQLAFVRPVKLSAALLQLGSVLIAGVTIYLSVLALMLWADLDWLAFIALGAPKAFFYVGLGVIPATLLRDQGRPSVLEWLRYSALGALPVVGLNLGEQGLQSGLWEITNQPFAHNLLSLGVAVCSGAVFHGIRARVQA